MRKIILLGLILLIWIVVPSYAVQAAPSVRIDNKLISFDVQPFLDQGRVYVPMRAIFENLGAVVHWDDKTQTVKAGKDNTLITITVGSKNATINGEPITLDAPARWLRQRVMVPVRFVSESLGCQVVWETQTQTVHITSTQPDEDPENKPHPQDTIPVDLGSVLQKDFGSIDGFTHFTIKPTVSDGLVTVVLQLNDEEAVNQWRNISSEKRSSYLAQMLDRLDGWYSDKTIDITVSYTTYYYTFNPAGFDVPIKYDPQRGWYVSNSLPVGHAIILRTPSLREVNPHS